MAQVVFLAKNMSETNFCYQSRALSNRGQIQDFLLKSFVEDYFALTLCQMQTFFTYIRNLTTHLEIEQFFGTPIF